MEVFHIFCRFYAAFHFNKRYFCQNTALTEIFFSSMQSFDNKPVYRVKPEMEIAEEQLAEGCREGSDTARKELYTRYAGRLLALCMRYAGDRAMAEDLLHDAFLKIFGAFDRFSYRGPGSLRAWMERITVNVALEWLRNRNKLGCVPLDEGRTQTDEAEVDPLAVSRVPREVLLRFVSELPDGYRAVFNLYCIEEYSHREIAEMLGINEKSSSSQLFRARALLARRVREYMESH